MYIAPTTSRTCTGVQDASPSEQLKQGPCKVRMKEVTHAEGAVLPVAQRKVGYL
jgi:hypothetical protein